MNCIGLAVVHLVWSHQADPGVMMILIVPVEEATAEAFGVLNAAEVFGEAPQASPHFVRHKRIKR
jgi:hypothetical protein